MEIDMAILEVKNIEKHFGSTKVLENISFDLEQGQALAIIGSSGSGKTTLLRCLNFLETPIRAVSPYTEKHCLTRLILPPRKKVRFEKNAFTSDWYSSPLTCFPSTPL